MHKPIPPITVIFFDNEIKKARVFFLYRLLALFIRRKRIVQVKTVMEITVYREAFFVANSHKG